MRVENESDSSWGKSEFENGNESSHMSDAKKYANFSGFRYSPTSCWGRVYGEGKPHPGKVYHLVEVYLPLPSITRQTNKESNQGHVRLVEWVQCPSS